MESVQYEVVLSITGSIRGRYKGKLSNKMDQQDKPDNF